MSKTTYRKKSNCERFGTKVEAYNSWYDRCPNCALAVATGKEVKGISGLCSNDMHGDCEWNTGDVKHCGCECH